MSAIFANYILEYGYWSIFLLVFLQEIGVPSFPNELILLYTGYLAYTGILNLFIAFIIVVSADVSGTFILYILFFYGGSFLIKYKPKWLPIPYKIIHALKNKMRDGGRNKIFLGRLIPYLRGYISVIAGILHFNTKDYGMMILFSAVIWSGGYVMIGWLAGPFWNLLFNKIDILTNWMIIIPICLTVILSIKWVAKKYILSKA